jgi:hypothetical protein
VTAHAGRAVAFAVLGLALAVPAFAADSPPSFTFPNGSVGTAEDRCGAGDLCAALKLPNGDTISVYNGGAIRCKPYTLKVVRMHGDTKLFDYDAQTDTAHGFFTAGNCSDTFAKHVPDHRKYRCAPRHLPEHRRIAVRALGRCARLRRTRRRF